MQKLLSKLPTLSVNTTSKHPTATDSLRIKATLPDETPSTSTSENAEDSTPRPTSSSIEPPMTTNVMIKHSSAFNSARESGMSKLEQLQFVEKLKGMIIDVMAEQASSLADVVATDFRVVMARKNRGFSPAMTGFCNAAVYVATLIGSFEGGAGVVVEQSEECEYLADAVEGLWEKVLVRVGEEVGEKLTDIICVGTGQLKLTIVVEGLKVGKPVPVEDAASEQLGSGETLVVSEG